MKKTLLLFVSVFPCLLLASCGNKTDNKSLDKAVVQEKMTVTVLDIGQADVFYFRLKL